MACAFQRHGLTRHHDLAAPGRIGLAEAQRADAEGVTEGEQPMPGNQRHHGVGTLDAAVHGRHGLEHGVRGERQVARHQLQLVRQHVDQHLGIAAGVDVAAVHGEELVLQRMGVCEVAVVHQHDAERCIDVKGLGLFLGIGIARRGVAHLTEADMPRQRTHVAGAKDVAHHATGLVHEALGALHGDDACRILPAVLQEQQRVIDQLVGGRLGDDADDAAHGLPWGWRKGGR